LLLNILLQTTKQSFDDKKKGLYASLTFLCKGEPAKGVFTLDAALKAKTRDKLIKQKNLPV